MARSRWSDYLPAFRFWAMDISGSKQIPVFTPLFGFSGISGPKISVELESFKDGTYNYPRHVVKGATVNPITFTRAASLYDSDFYDWIYYAIEGTNAAKDQGFTNPLLLGDAGGPVRRDLLVIHFSSINLNPSSGSVVGSLAAAAAEAVIFAGLTGGNASGVDVGATATGAAAASGFRVGPFSQASWLPARAWTLHGCIPTEYIAASDFDANSNTMSLMNISVQPEFIEEFSMGSITALAGTL